MLVVQSNSLCKPTIVLSTIPLGLVGVTFGLQITNSSFEFFTIFGVTPLHLGGTAMFKPMAITIIFGLMFATGLTLLVVPVLCSMFFRVSYAGQS